MQTKPNAPSVEFGTEYEDTVTGLKGIAVSFCTNITGRDSVLLATQVKDGETEGSSLTQEAWFDTQRLINVKTQQLVAEALQQSAVH